MARIKIQFIIYLVFSVQRSNTYKIKETANNKKGRGLKGISVISVPDIPLTLHAKKRMTQKISYRIVAGRNGQSNRQGEVLLILATPFVFETWKHTCTPLSISVLPKKK